MHYATLALFFAGLLILIVGAEALVRGSAGLAALAGLSPLVIGLTVVAYGTSTPELMVSLYAALAGNSDVAVANVVGSNIFNVLLILGLSALILPLTVDAQLVRLDVPIMVGVSALLWLLGLNSWIGRWEGLLLTAGVVAYTLFAVRLSRRESQRRREREERPGAGDPAAGGGATGAAAGVANSTAAPLPAGAAAWVRGAALVVVGLGLLGLGARWLVDAATALARALGLSDVVIGLTIVAAGTSLPEAAASVVAALRGQRDIAVGNVVGSNIYNILGIAGLSALLAPSPLRVHDAVLRFDLPAMMAVAVACLPFFFSGHRLDRWEGALFIAYYAAYTAFLVMAATRHDALPAFSGIMLEFVLPLTAVTVGVIAVREIRARRRA
jgi:cation:H+ antiporter